ncbi:transcription factor Tfb2-domain-containing protein [Mrakia frigida]|uniref:TFIIH/NER complex subunit TFB2 n=1 Tax=Mrakia frigida TaxID=29902 RepID=UPI003FCC0590
MSSSSSSSSPSFTGSIHTYLDSQSQLTLARLYSTPAGCLAIFRLLPPLPRQIVLSLLWLETPMRKDDLLVWMKGEEGRRLASPALALLSHRAIIKETSSSSSSSKSSKLSITSAFKEGLRRALTGGGTHASFGIPSEKEDKNAKSVEELDEIAVGKWETILHFMVSKGGSINISPVPPKASVLYLLANSGLMADPIASGSNQLRAERLQITSRGFQFLLEDVGTQQWDLMLNYLRLAPEREMDPIEALGFLFMLGSLELGRGYSTENLTATQLTMLEDLNETGFIYRRTKTSKRFYPTRLATTLSSPSSITGDPAADQLQLQFQQQQGPPPTNISTVPTETGFIVIETNFRVYAYTDNVLQISVLNLFVQFKARFPNMVVGEITRRKMRNALEKGITADQIISYLTVHAHPQMHKNNPLLPVTVQDQLRLYETELHRVKTTDGSFFHSFFLFAHSLVLTLSLLPSPFFSSPTLAHPTSLVLPFPSGHLYSDFTSLQEYTMALAYANQLNVVVHDLGKERMMFFVTTEGHGAIKSYVSGLEAELNALDGGGGGWGS